ncbi:endolytic transglycosylase MltG [Nocardia transvalensis]|uniref:endolytic transglycosylase MltG n=1 Tax=Nocardia transvalensis TaxID=37333 RepID=UPI0018960097|nr:endolytic transglycosylase MltG [Nocardia transvalensis]MBF6332110.1 endolytic transglycosylase MltG [Nocardia transvalensis]
MNDRWTRAEERYRQRTEERRYRRADRDWDDDTDPRGIRGIGARHAAPDDWDDYEDDTTVIPRYTDDQEPPVRSGRSRAAGRVDEWDDGDPEDYWDDDDQPAGRRSRGRAAKPDPRGRSAGRDADGRSGQRSTGGRGGLRGQTQRGRRSRVASRKAAERKRRRRNLLILGCVFVALFVAAGGYAGYKFIAKLGGPEDFAGPPGPITVVSVQPGDTSQQIAKTMFDKGVVASTGAFYEAAVRNSGITSVQPGYYAVPTHSKGVDAVAALLNKANRVGNVVISEGKRLHDSTDVNTGARNEGIYRKVADASCYGSGAAKKCVTYEQLDAAGSSTDLAALGVPGWAMDAVRQVPDRSRQLEGLIAAGTWNFDPTLSPEQILKQLVSQSTASYETTGLLQSGTAGSPNKMNPYQTLIAASLVEREARPNDMPKVARVIVNRLADNQKLEFDSTVNYTLDRTEVATTDADRARPTPWNTYAMTGLPATPISSPSLDALRAVENPTPGPWLYFVTVDKQGTTLFTDSFSEHQRNVLRAQQSGILDSGKRPN